MPTGVGASGRRAAQGMTADYSTGESRQESGESSETTDRRSGDSTQHAETQADSRQPADEIELPATVTPPAGEWTQTAVTDDHRGPILDPGRSQPATAGSRPTAGTAIGLDVGEVTPATLAPATTQPDPTHFRRIEYDREATLARFERLRVRHDGSADDATEPRLPSASATTTPATSEEANALRGTVREVARRAIRYVQSFHAPVVVVESLGWPRRPLGWHTIRDLPFRAWLLPAIQTAVIDRARAVGVPVVAGGGHSTVQCHRCSQRCRMRDRLVRCGTENCPVEGVDRDVSAAVTLSRRI